jgi:hypothetical protein
MPGKPQIAIGIVRFLVEQMTKAVVVRIVRSGSGRWSCRAAAGVG